MNANDVQQRVAAVDAVQGDSEVAHGLEDALWADVLRAIADGTADQPAEMARIALTTTDIDFDRWYA